MLSRGNGHRLKQKNVPFEREETLTQIDQEGCRVSILGDIEKASGHGPGQPVLSGPA